MSGEREPTVPIAHRPVPFRCRGDLEFADTAIRGVPALVVKDPISLRYFHLRATQSRLLRWLDGRSSLQELRGELQAEFPHLEVPLAEVQDLILDLHQKGLVETTRPNTAAMAIRKSQLARRSQWLARLANPFFVQLPGFDPLRLLLRANSVMGWCLSRRGVPLGLAVILASLIQVAVRIDALRERLPEFQQFFGWPNVAYLWLTLGVTKLIHEIGHGVACVRHGAHCAQIGVALLLLAPTMYCDVTDCWMLKSRWKRIGIAVAGVYVESLVAAVAIFAWSSVESGLLSHLLFNVFFVSAVSTVIFNLNPLLKFDGYFALADLVEIPNLRDSANMALVVRISQYLGAQESPGMDPEVGAVKWLPAFAIASWGYGIFVLGAMAMTAHLFLKSHQLGSMSLLLMVGLILLSGSRTVISVRHSLKRLRASRLQRGRITLATAITISLFVGAAFFPFPIYIEAPFYLEPIGSQQVYAPTSGELSEIHAIPGEHVAKGVVLVQLRSEDLREELEKLRVERTLAETRLRSLEIQKIHAEVAVARQTIEQVAARIADCEERQARTAVRAPVAGSVIPAPWVPEPPHDQRVERLGGLVGTALDARNVGAFVEAGTLVAIIAPSGEFQAVLYCDQHDRMELSLGQAVTLQCDSTPGRRLQGRVTSISARHQEFVPHFMSNKFGGTLPTTTDANGRERLTSMSYQVLVEFDNDAASHRLGMRGRARCLIMSRSLAGWLWRSLRQTVFFRL